MNTSGEAADQVVRMSLEVGEAALKISGTGAKHLAVMLYTVLKEKKKTQAIITIAAVVLGTMATRFIPFIIFPEGKNPPEFVKYLGTVLPYAAIGLLVIYCLKDVPASSTHGLPEAIAILFIVWIHKWKKNTLLSIGGGTVLYMVLVQTVFH